MIVMVLAIVQTGTMRDNSQTTWEWVTVRCQVYYCKVMPTNLQRKLRRI